MKVVIPGLVLGGTCVWLCFWRRLWRETNFQSPRNMSAVMSSLCHAAYWSKSSGKTFVQSHKPPDECECKVLSNLKKKQDKRQERPMNTDWMIVIMRRRFSLWCLWPWLHGWTHFTCWMNSHTVSLSWSWSVVPRCNRAPFQAADDQSRVQVQQRCALA